MKIRAAVSRDSARPPAVETLDIEEPRPGEILVRLVASGICHTDLNVHERDRSPKPIVLGHEGAGIVERVGSGVTRLAPGDRVVLGVNFCGECPSCRRNAHGYCHEAMPRNFGGRSIRGIVGGDSSPGLFLPLLFEYYRQGRLPFDRLIRFYPFEDIAQAFADCERGTTVKAVLRM